MNRLCRLERWNRPINLGPIRTRSPTSRVMKFISDPITKLVDAQTKDRPTTGLSRHSESAYTMSSPGSSLGEIAPPPSV